MPLNRVRDFVKKFDPELEPIVFDQEMKTSMEAANVLGVEVGQIAKSILFQSGETFGLFVAAGDVRINTKTVKSLLGKNPRMTSPETVERITGFRVGAVCPFALAADIPIYIDPSLSRYDVVYTAAGIPESLLPITFEKLVQITNGTLIPATCEDTKS
ncbi:YbaK/EbsC family protein [Effusibacillus lacus]|uniref:Aminoacyl-tRNA deacylase n=1 Tax=Effusibacillus lacus TaxID=1348429 RepID=A0A292YMN2_9BACL|nr:YbaK/EbsC family protein [Effusibacillus lacus]TCS70952.1 prolyl-tRNA editing enzyme YbaK/EbsC (Cys-tRNA(Pro) deacylase) [Effusibacillus lacus]GAX90013.1 aminoacyl-tRNA deacylase [Effusibacillus lacus]